MTRLDRLTEKLQLNHFKLTSLLDITKAINDNTPVDELLEVYQSIIHGQLGISKLMLFNKHNNWDCLLQFGIEKDVEKINAAELFDEYNGISLLQSNSALEQAGFDILIPVHHKSEPLAYLVIGDLDEDELKISPAIKHMNFIQTITNILVVAIENKRLVNESIAQERTKKEFELAGEMQSMLVPQDFNIHPDFEVSVFYQPHLQLGGDYYDVIPLNENEIILCIADVSGKGVAASFLMANLQANLHALVNHTDYSLRDIVEELNGKVNKSARGEKFITLFIAKLNFKSGSMRYINAGHNPPVILNNENLYLLENGCIGLGMLDEIPEIKEGHVRLKGETIAVCYTDGVTELENPKNQEFGVERLGELILNHSNLSMDDLNKTIVNEMDNFRENSPYFDDTALLSCRFVLR